MFRDRTARPLRRFFGCGSVLALTAALPMVAAAQDGQPVVLAPVVIEASVADNDAATLVATRSGAGSKMATDLLDTPASVSVITSREIQQRNATTVEQVLAYSAGVTADYYGSDDRFDNFRIRGFDVYTYRDGLSLGRPFGNIREEVFAFERVEVIRGANSTAFGISDPGGMVNYVTKRPRPDRFGEAYVAAGSNDHAEVGFDFGDRITPDGTLSYRLTGKVRDASAEYDYSRDDEKFLMAGVTWQPDAATSLSVMVDHLDRDGVPGSGGHPVGTDFARSRFFGEPDFNYRGTRRTTLTAILDHDFGGGLSLGSTLRYGESNTDFGYAYVTGLSTEAPNTATRDYFGNDSSAKEFSWDARLQYDRQLGEIASRTLLGIEYRDTSARNATYWGNAPTINWQEPVYSGRPASVPLLRSSTSDQETKAIYLQQELTFADRYILSLGARHDWLDITQTNRMTGVAESGDISETTGRVALTYKATPELSLYGSYAESVVPASLTVEPERGEQFELGVKYQPAGSRTLVSAAVYDLTKNNITRTDPLTNLPETIGEIRARGFDVEAKSELSRHLSLTAAYSYIDSEITENGTSGNVGNRLSFVPEHMGALWVSYATQGTGAAGDMTLSLGARYESGYFFNDTNTLKNGGHVIYDAAFSYQMRDDTSLAVNVSNVFDKKFTAYGGFGADFYNPGRQVTATLRRTW